jgi:hypothetical protein
MTTKAAPEPPQAGPTLITQAGFRYRPGEPLIEGRRPVTWLADAIRREYEITRRMGLLDPKPARGGVASA